MVKTESVQKPQKVLIAEDNPVVRKGLTNLLSQWGYVPVETADGHEAWDVLEKDNSIRLAILDWNMPGLSGMQVCQRLRRRTDKPYVYILIFSVRKTIEEQVLALNNGADDYLAKPAPPAILRAKLDAGQRILETALAHRQAPVDQSPVE